MNLKIVVYLLLSIFLAATAVSTVAMAGDPLEKKDDFEFLMSDPDGDNILTIDEFAIGTDPFNVDSDNDGLPDWWELEYSPWSNPDHNALMDPTDPADAHLDFDYLPKYNATGFEIGEQDAKFSAIEYLKGKKPITWPSNPNIMYTQLVFNENSKHYDNYEEYYRPYTDIWHYDEDVIRYMHTSPVDSDTDDDGYLDPDDQTPVDYFNDGIYPGIADEIEKPIMDDIQDPNVDINENMNLMLQNFDNDPQAKTDFEIKIETDRKIKNSNSQSPSDNKNDWLIIDVDNDGI